MANDDCTYQLALVFNKKTSKQMSGIHRTVTNKKIILKINYNQIIPKVGAIIKLSNASAAFSSVVQ